MHGQITLERKRQELFELGPYIRKIYIIKKNENQLTHKRECPRIMDEVVRSG
jgi:hypothetical protein